MKKPVAYFFLLAQLIPGTVFAGDYKMVLGKGIEVCEAYLKNLNSFPKHPPMVCERPLNPRFPEFRKPAWKELDGREHLDLLKQIWRSFDDLTAEQFERSPLKERWIASLKKPGEQNGIAIQVAELDVDRDGIPEPVLRYDASVPCDPLNESNFAGSAGTEFYILTPDQRGVDVWKSGNFNVLGSRHEIFLYKGQVYITGWTGNLGFHGGELRVTSPARLPAMNIQACKFTYQSAKQRRQP